MVQCISIRKRAIFIGSLLLLLLLLGVESGDAARRVGNHRAGICIGAVKAWLLQLSAQSHSATRDVDIIAAASGMQGGKLVILNAILLSNEQQHYYVRTSTYDYMYF
jgi:hypothetical protein